MTSAVALTFSACGGGGGNTTSPITTVATNRPPITSTSGSTIIATKSQPVTLNASESSDPDGDSLTYSWTQISGSTVALNTPSSASLTVTAPDVSAAETLEFEVIVSDGSLTSTDRVSLNVELFEPSLISPVTSTYSDTPATNSNLAPRPLSIINNPDGGFRIYWRWVNSERQETPTSYQDYTVDGEKIGAEVDSIIQNTNEIFSHHGDTIRSGDTLYNLVGTANYSRDIEYMDESSTIRGDLEGVLLTRGDIYDAHLSRDRSYRSVRVTAISQDRLLVTTTHRPDTDDGATIEAIFIEPNGSSNKFFINQNNFNFPSGATVAEFGDNSFAAFWDQDGEGPNDDSDQDFGEDIVMQRFSDDGNLLGGINKINDFIAASPRSLSVIELDNGDVFVSWVNGHFDSDLETISARIIKPDGTMETDVIEISEIASELDFNRNFTSSSHDLTKLPSGQILMTVQSSLHKLKAEVINPDGTRISNPFIYDAEESLIVRPSVTPLTDGRILLNFSEIVTEIGTPASQTDNIIGFYPLGKTSD